MDETPAGISADLPAQLQRSRSGSSNRQRTLSFNVRVTAEEAATLAAMADAAGLPVAGYLRSAALRKRRPRAARLPLTQQLDLRRVLSHIGHLGANVNQLAKAFNTDASMPEAMELAAIRVEVMELRADVRQALGLPA